MPARWAVGVLVLFVIPAAFFLVLDALLAGELPPWCRVPARVPAALTAVVRVARAVLGRGPWGARRVVYDPFAVLELQHRLAALSAEIQWLEDVPDRFIFARAHRIKVAQSAYDALLGEACRLAGVTVEALDLGTLEAGATRPAQRAREELELASRGWFW